MSYQILDNLPLYIGKMRSLYPYFIMCTPAHSTSISLSTVYINHAIGIHQYLKKKNANLDVKSNHI